MCQSPAHVACYLRFLAGGGAERVIVNLLHGFVKRELKVDLILHSLSGSFISQVPPEVRIIELPTSKLLIGIFLLARYLKQEQPQFILSALHFTNEVAIMAKYLARTKTKVAVSEHNTLSIHASHLSGSERWSPIAARLLYPWADKIITVSNHSAQDLAKVTKIPLKKIEMIYNPAITPELSEKAQQTIEHPWFSLGQPPVILGVGRLTEQKDFQTLIRAFAKVIEIQDARLMILGTGEDRNKLNNLVKELGLVDNVHFAGFSNNPYPYIAKSAVFVLSSLWEGLPTVIIEAMALGTPVVATDCPGGSAEILSGGKYGELVPMGDSNAMAQAILKVLSGDVKLVPPIWLEQFTLEKSIEKYLQTLGLST